VLFIPTSADHTHLQLSIPTSNSPSPHPTLLHYIQLFIPTSNSSPPKSNSSFPNPTLHPLIQHSILTSALLPHICSPTPHQLSIPTSSFQHTSTPGRRSPPHQVPWASLGCRIHEHVQLMGKNHSSTFGPYLCFQEHLFVLPTQTHPCLVHVGSSDAPLPPVSCLLCIEDASAQVWDVIVI